MDKKQIAIDVFVSDFKAYLNNDIVIEFPKSKDVVCRLLRKFCDMGNDEKYIDAWGILLNQIPLEFLSDTVIDVLVTRKIQLELLAHMSLSDEWLLRIYDKDNIYIEALQTVGARYLKRENTCAEFRKFLNKYICESLYDYLLDQVIHLKNYSNYVLENCNILIMAALSNFEEGNSINKSAQDVKNYIKIRFSNAVEVLYNAFESNEYLQLLALSENRNCPKSLLCELTKVKDIKFGKQIRNNAKSLL